MVATNPMMPDSDAPLLERWSAGDERAFDQLYARHAGRLTGYCTRLLGRAEEAEEVVVDTFLRLVEAGPRAGEVRAWLYTVAHRACLDRLRRRARWERLFGWFGVAGDAPHTPLDHALGVEAERRAAAAIDALPVDHRSALLLAVVHELPGAEVAAILGLTEQQVRSQVSYARKRLRAALDPEPGGPRDPR